MLQRFMNTKIFLIFSSLELKLELKIVLGNFLIEDENPLHIRLFFLIFFIAK